MQPKSPLEQDDFVKLAKAVDPYIEATGGLAGLIIEAPAFPGWDSFGTMVTHFRFVRDHHKRKENRSRNGLLHGRCRRAFSVTLCVSRDQAFPGWADRGSKTMDQLAKGQLSHWVRFMSASSEN